MPQDEMEALKEDKGEQLKLLQQAYQDLEVYAMAALMSCVRFRFPVSLWVRTLLLYICGPFIFSCTASRRTTQAFTTAHWP